MDVGVWLVGARGSVATTVVAGAAALRAGLATPIGCVTEGPDFTGAGLPPLDRLVFGGHDVAGPPLVKKAEELSRSGVIPAPLPRLVADDLEAAEAEIRHGTDGDAEPGGATGQAAVVRRLAADITGFRERHGLARVVVIHVASTEPPVAPHPAHHDLGALTSAMEEPGRVLPPSSLYAFAALSAGCPYADFTPSTGVSLPALDELARSRGLPYAGRDAKTGETLVKTALAPMFASRALAVRSWSGTNLLGGGDGATLADPAAGESKRISKDRALPGILGHPVEGQTHIDHVPHLGDWKTAWDHITFEGFLGVRMSLQFTWQGCDSALAAPLVLDLARLLALAHERGQAGVVGELGFFFKDPLGLDEHRLQIQYDLLRAWAGSPA
ncbi:inositol-3-phosphate synthase [Sphaerisporangium sp. TRM90804]|uniref:inositol-3-phosphate synthase n=1 Tax=Sphaerisporangium sp. TRM90804 TaxID=3031113 RepID=UPI0024492471|nr:inositol-3-phosphate synthase [Sphaerisporangium sp. TRM90804]MDH2426321.1 inositol-3-phosphate synthase [Sphaerisporangium sp. TRM90804]